MAEQEFEREMSEQIDENARTLNEYFSGHADRQGDVQAILDTFLSGTPNSQTAGLLLEALSIYAGIEVAEVLAGYLVYADQYPQLLPDYETSMDDEVAQLLRRWLAIHGSAMTEAANLRDTNPNAWRLLNREIFYEEITQAWQVNLQIVKFNGEATDFRETPNSIAILTHGVLDTLLRVEEYIGREAFDQQSITDLIDTMNTFIRGHTEDAEPASVTVESRISSDGVS